MSAGTCPRFLWLAAGTALVSCELGGCTVGPDYHAPELTAPAAYQETEPSASIGGASETADLSTWWRRLNDPILTALINRARAYSPTLQAAASRVREARLAQIQARAAGLPAINATANALALDSNHPSPGAASAQMGGAGAASGLPIPPHVNLYTVGFDASWEIDLFGGTRRSVEKAAAETGVELWASRDAEVTLSAEVAHDYLALRAAEERSAIGHAQLRHQKALLDLIRARREAGFVTDLDVNQQSALVATAAAEIPQIEALTKSLMHALAVLCGVAPESFTVSPSDDGFVSSEQLPSLPIGLPSDLLRRRPDVREAERRLAAANAEIGIQTANLYPKLNLIALPGFVGSSLGGLFDQQNLSTVALGMASVPVFNAGRTHAAIGAAREKRLQAAQAYQLAFLGALRDVEDALARYRLEKTRQSSLGESVVSASKSLAIAQDQYRTGWVSFVNVLEAQNALLNAKDELAQSQGEVATDWVAIFKALGGGWSN